VVMDGVGTITLRGEGPSALFSTNGVGNIRAFDFIAETVDVTTNGVGNAEVHATVRLDAHSNGVGNITYDGNPTEGRQTAAGIGRIRAR